ncbi:TIGR02270 family protein [Paraburkholderia sp. DHOC27]|uniref:TIGR02270 family protein n=1 Tax=Paraburkholderia sp. DHOC27 TaxID=2303330 RepID=UPI000E3D87AE|nr:TIGR02270 family protein [Paraburkholderia sp. DHOC27]RFU48312.1 TIGR02270 family protein [Paraburkholderia sp. DHOC27]
MSRNFPPTIPAIVQQHVDEAAALRNVRAYLVRAPHIKLKDLGRLDERIAAHLDGIAVSGPLGMHLCKVALERPARGEVFAAAVRYIESGFDEGLVNLMALAEALPETWPGLHSAFGWASAASLREIVSALLHRNSVMAQLTGLAACAMHRVNPGIALESALVSRCSVLSNRALRCAGEVGRCDLLRQCLKRLQSDDDECRFFAAKASLLLGDRQVALDAMVDVAQTPGPMRALATTLAMIAAEPDATRLLLDRVSSPPGDERLTLRAIAHAGDTQNIPKLIELMSDTKLARLAGEAFSFITGADFIALQLDRPRHLAVRAVAGDSLGEDADYEDEGLPWPDAEKVSAWWNRNARRFSPARRYFVGAPPSWEHCLRVLQDGYQRQRVVAAHYLCLLRPGTIVFNCAAPAWRQLRGLNRLIGG